MFFGDEEVVFRVVEGTIAKQGDVPYQVGFKIQLPQQRHLWATFCGGTLITSKEILSAAHCFHAASVWDMCFGDGRAPPDKIKSRYAVAGQLTTFSHYHGYDSEEHGQWRKIRSARYPVDFNFPTNDIAVVFLEKEYNLNKYVQPIKYSTENHDYTDSICLLSGFGRVDEETQSRYLRDGVAFIFRLAPLRALSDNHCSQVHHSNMARFVCTSDAVSDIGKGDSGGPLVCSDPDIPNSTKLVGIVSGKRRATKAGSFFTRVSSYRKFIKITLENNSAKLSLTIPCYVLVFVHWIL